MKSLTRPAELTVDAEQPLQGKLTGRSRREFIVGIAAAGASTMGAVALQRTGLDLFSEEAFASHGRNRFSDFNAIAASSADAFEVPNGFRADVLISWDDLFRGAGGKKFRYGFNNDFLAYFPIHGSEEGLLFVNHEYPDPFFLHGYKPNGSPKTPAQVQEEQDMVGNSILHVKRRRDGTWKVVSPSKYNRRIYGDRPDLPFTGPLVGAPGIGTSAHGSLGNCSGGVTPWGTAISCEENYDGYGSPVTPNIEFFYGWHQFGGRPRTRSTSSTRSRSTAGSASTTRTTRRTWAASTPRSAASATRTRPSGMCRARSSCSTWATTRRTRASTSSSRIAASRRTTSRTTGRSSRPGQLYIARWEPEGRRRFATAGSTTPLNATEGTGTWVPVQDSELDDTATKLRARFGTAEYDTHFATNRPEDVEVADNGHVFVALTNNSSVLDSHGVDTQARSRRTTTPRRSSSRGVTTRPVVRPGRAIRAGRDSRVRTTSSSTTQATCGSSRTSPRLG